MADNWDLTTSDGTVVLTLPGTFNGELEAETSDGVVRASHRCSARAPTRTAAATAEDREARRERPACCDRDREGARSSASVRGIGSIRIERYWFLGFLGSWEFLGFLDFGIA